MKSNMFEYKAEDGIVAVDWNHATNRIAISTFEDAFIRIIDGKTGVLLYEIENISGRMYNRYLKWNVHGTHLASIQCTGELSIWDLTRKPFLSVRIRLGEEAGPIAWGPNGILAVSHAYKIHRVVASTGERYGDVIYSGFHRRIEWSSFLNSIVIGSKYNLCIFDTELRVATGYRNCSSLSVAPDGKQVAYGTPDGFVGIVDIATGEDITKPIRIHDGVDEYANVIELGWNPAGSHVAIAFVPTIISSGMLVILDSATLQRVCSFDIDGSGWIRAVMWNPEGTVIAIARGDLITQYKC